MPKRDVGVLLEDILSAIDKISRFITGVELKKFIKDEKTVDAVVRNLEIIGEAARQIPSEFASQHPEIPWPHIIGLRNRIVHDYAGIDLELIWEIINNDLKSLRPAIEHLYNKENGRK